MYRKKKISKRKVLKNNDEYFSISTNPNQTDADIRLIMQNQDQFNFPYKSVEFNLPYKSYKS